MSYDEEDSLSQSGGRMVTVDESGLDEDTLQVLDYLGILRHGPDGESFILWDPRLISHRQLVDVDVPFVDLFENLVRTKRMFIPEFLERVLGDVARRYPDFRHLLDVPRHLRDPDQEARDLAVQMEIDQAIIGQLLQHAMTARMDPRTGALSQSDFEERVTSWIREVVCATDGISAEDSGVPGHGVYHQEQGVMTLIRVHNPEAHTEYLVAFANPDQATSQLLNELELTRTYAGVPAYRGDEQHPDDFYFLTAGESVEETVRSLQEAINRLGPIPGLGVKPLISGTVVSLSEMIRLSHLLFESGMHWKAGEYYTSLFQMWTLVMRKMVKYVSVGELVEHVAHLHLVSPETFNSLRVRLDLGAVNPDHIIQILETGEVKRTGPVISQSVLGRLRQYAGVVFHLTHADDRSVLNTRLRRVRSARTRTTRVLERNLLCTDYAALRIYKHLLVPDIGEFVGALFEDSDTALIMDSIEAIRALEPRVDAIREQMHQRENRQLADSSADLPPVIQPPQDLVIDAAPIDESPSAVGLARVEPPAVVSSESTGSVFSMSISDPSGTDSEEESSGGSGMLPPTAEEPDPEDSLEARHTVLDDSATDIPMVDSDGWPVPDTLDGQSHSEPTLNDPDKAEAFDSIPSSASLKKVKQRGPVIEDGEPPEHPTTEFDRALDAAEITPPPEVATPVEIGGQAEGSESVGSLESVHGPDSEHGVRPVGNPYVGSNGGNGRSTADLDEPSSFHDPDGDIEVEGAPDSQDSKWASLDPPDSLGTDAVELRAHGAKDESTLSENTEPSGVALTGSLSIKKVLDPDPEDDLPPG